MPNETFVGIIDDILGKPLREDLKDFFRRSMPEDGELTVILARKCSALFSAFCKAYPKELGIYQAAQNVKVGKFGYVIHDHLLHEVLSLNRDNMPSKIKIVDDSLLHGTSLRKSFNSLCNHKYNGTVEAYVFAVNEQLADESIVKEINENQACQRPLYLLEQNGSSGCLSTAKLIDNYMFHKNSEAEDNKYSGCDYKISYSNLSPRRYLRKLSSMYIKVIHACSVGYVVNYPIFNLSFDDASQFFENNKFPSKDEFSCTQFKQEISSFIKVVHDATFTNEVSGNVCSISVILKNHEDYEQAAMIRMHANYNLHQVLIIPYMFHHQLMCPIKELYESAKLPQKIKDAMMAGFNEDNSTTLVHAIRYNRSIEIAKEVFGSTICDYLVSDLINSIFSGTWAELKPLLSDKNWFKWVSDTEDEQVKAIEEKSVIDELKKYNIPSFFHQNEYGLDPKSFDYFFDKMSNIYLRSLGVDIISLAQKIESVCKMKNLINPHTFITMGQDRGVTIPFTHVVVYPNTVFYAAVMRERDGEMSNLAYAGVKELAALPWLVYTIKLLSPQESWAEIKHGLWDIVFKKFSDDINRKYIPMIRHFFDKISDYEIGDYVIHDTAYYIYHENVNPEQRIYHEIFEEYSKIVRQNKIMDKEALLV